MNSEELRKLNDCLASMGFFIEELKRVGVFFPMKNEKDENNFMYDGIKIVFSRKQDLRK